MDDTPTNPLNQLFARWKAARGYGRGFASDGPIDPALYAKQPLKVLCILKEPSTAEYEVVGGLIGWLKDENSTFGSTWNVLARWAGDLIGSPIPRTSQGRDLRDRALEVLSKIAVMNLKKTNPSKQTDHIDLAAWAAQDADFIREQIGILNPDVIVGCGVRAELVWLLGIRPDELPVEREAVWGIRRPGQTLLFVRHPSTGAAISLGTDLHTVWSRLSD